MSRTECLARISQLDTMLRGSEAGWTASSGSPSVSSWEGPAANSSFSGVLAGLVGAGAPAAAAASPEIPAVASPAVASLPSVSSIQTSAADRFTSPLPGGRLTQSFGPSTEKLEHAATVAGVTYAHYHKGIDLAARLGSSVRAAASGTVIMAGRDSSGAVDVEIRHADGYVTMYGHLDPSLQVAVGDQVTAGQTVGKVGMTGHTTGPHLHFALLDGGGKAVDPSPYLAAGELPDTATSRSQGANS